MNATIIKTIKFNYYADKIVLQGYIQNSGSGFLEFQFNTKKQITKIIDSTNSGLYFTYLNDKIFEIKDTSISGIKYITNFIYDVENNLTHYEFKINDQIFANIDLEYNITLMPEELDTRFFNKDIKIIYIGGLNLVTKLGLNFGIGNRNTLIKRTETLAQTGQIFDIYLFKYEYNLNNEIIKRSMEFNEDTLYYRYNY